MTQSYYSFGQATTPATTEPAAAQPPTQTFWQRHGAEIIVGTITAVTGALAVYFAMRLVEFRDVARAHEARG